MILPHTPELDTHTLYVAWLWNGGRTKPQPDIEQAINQRINFRIGQPFEAVQKWTNQMRCNSVNCDGCGNPKREANRWLMGWQSEHGYALGDWSDELERRRYDKPTHHFCSESCGLKYQAKFLRRDVQPVVDLVA